MRQQATGSRPTDSAASFTLGNVLGDNMSSTPQATKSPLHALGWLVAIILLLVGVWCGIVLPLVSMAFGLIVPGVIALIAGFGIIVILRRYRTA